MIRLALIVMLLTEATYAATSPALLASARRRNSSPTPVGWWKFNEGSGTNAVDSSVNGNNGMLVNTPTWITGPNGNGALQFARASDKYVNLGNPSALQITGAISISVWVYVDSTNAPSDLILGKDKDTGGRAYTVDKQVNLLRLYINGGGVPPVANLTHFQIDPTTWTHAVFTFEPGVLLRGYKNGVANGTSTGTAPASIPTATSNVLIGRREYAGYTQPLDGRLDDVRIYNRVLTAAEILAIYNEGAQ